MFTSFKKTIAVVLVAMMTITALAGCGKKEVALDEKAIFMTVGDREVTAGMANFYVRYQQALIESVYASYMGDNVWKQEIEAGVTYEDNMKDTILEQLKELYILAANVDKYDVTLTDEEKEAIKATATEFEKANSKDAKKKASTSKEYAREYLELALIKQKMTDSISDDIDKEVATEEIAQKGMKYVLFATKETDANGEKTELNEKQISKLKKDAQDLLDAAKKNGSLDTPAKEKGITVETLSFDASSTALDSDVIKAADALKKGEFSNVIKTEEGFYVVQLVSEFDSEATVAKKNEILAQRGSERYNELVAEWIKEVKVKVNDDVWKNMSLHALKISSDFAEATAQ